MRDDALFTKRSGDSSFYSRAVNKILLLFILIFLPFFFNCEGCKPEPETPIQLCWLGEAGYLANTVEHINLCDSVEPLVWNRSQVPLSVTPRAQDLNEINSLDRKYAELLYSVREANTQAGFKLFEISSNEDITVIIGNTPLRRYQGGYCRFYKSRGLLKAEVYINAGQPQRTTHIVTMHELGHAAGLPHSDHPDSFMYPYWDEERAEKMILLRWTDSQRAMLRNLYMPR